MEDFESEKCDLSLVFVPIIEEAISFNPMTGHTIDLRNLNRGMFIGWPTIMAKEIVSLGNVEMAKFHAVKDNTGPARVIPPLLKP